MTRYPKISIAVAVYGVELYIEECLNSLVHQTYKNIEIIIVNDGSLDGAPKICDRFAASDTRITVIHQKNSGLVSARKAGAKIATGDFITFVDGDDWVQEDHIESLTTDISSDTDLVIAGFTRDFMGTRKLVTNYFSEGTYSRKEIEEIIIPRAIYNGLFFQHGISTYLWNKLFKTTKILKYLNQVDERIVMGEDSSVTYPYLMDAKKIRINNSTGYVYRQRANSIIKSVPDIETEYLRLSILFQHLKKNLRHLPPEYDLNNQVKHYFYSLLLNRSGGLLRLPNNEEFYFPFKGIKPNSKIIIYNSGAFGQHLHATLQNIDKFIVSGWIDEDYDESIQAGLPLMKLTDLKSINFDYLLIASIDSEHALQISKMLSKQCIDPEKIRRVDLDIQNLNASLVKIGFDTENYQYDSSLKDIKG